MKHALKTFALAAAFAVTALSAGAATVVSVTAHSTQGAGNTADVYASNYGAYLPTGSTWSNGDATVYVPPGNLSKVYESPFNNTGLSETRNYFSVGGVDKDGDGSNSPNTLTFGGAGVTLLRMLWGSIDTYNTLTFSNGYSITGTQLAAMLGLPTNPQGGNFEHVALLTFKFDDDDAVTSATFVSGFNNTTAKQKAAFEFAFAPVPLPAGGLLLIGALGGLAALRRRKAV
jgi:hypothetical protein